MNLCSRLRLFSQPIDSSFHSIGKEILFCQINSEFWCLEKANVSK